MKLINKIFKTIGLMFVLIFIATLYGCEMDGITSAQLSSPDFTVLVDDRNVTVFIEDTLNADSYYLYVYQDNGLKGKYAISEEQALMGFEVYLGYGEFELAAQAVSQSTMYTDSLLSDKKDVVLTKNTSSHTHVYIDGVCECGQKDPNGSVVSKYTISYVLNGGVLSNDAPTVYTVGETVFLIDPTKDNNTFEGWYLNTDFSGEKISVISNKTTGNITLYAKWTSTISYTGYYEDANNLEGAALKKALRTIISTGFKGLTYGDLRYKLPYTDASLTDSSKMLLLFSHHEVEAKWDSATTWNREHVWPKSKGWFNEEGAGCDIHHIRPENVSVNSIHGNLPYGEVTNGSAVKCCGEVVAYKTGTYFEPLDDFKGDVARIIFYLLVRYSQSDSYPITNVAQSMNMLLEWHESDPVDAFETSRNERCYSLQNNRNPFIDHPEFADMIWG